MDRVLKRVGLSKRCSPSDKDKDENGDKVRRRRRTQSRRRYPQHSQPQVTKKTRGLFNIDWESVKDCKSCKSRAITRKLCSKRSDNELYRSNSFKFERFVRGNEEISTLGKKISLCDEYSLPVDHVNKKRPNSFAAPSICEWNVSSPNEEQEIEILETYSNPKDSKSQINQCEEGDSKYYTSPDREYSQPYTTDGSSEATSDEEFFGHVTVSKALELNSPDSITEAILPLVNLQSPERVDVKRHPSPYYYADLYKGREESCAPSRDVSATAVLVPSFFQYRKCCSLDEEDRERDEEQVVVGTSKKKTRPAHRYKKSSSLDTQSTDDVVVILKHNNVQECDRSAPMPPNRLVSPCSCLVSQDGLDEDDMTRQRHVYETAFDCRISKSDDDLDEIDKVSNHPVLHSSVSVVSSSASASASTSVVAVSTNSITARSYNKRRTCTSPSTSTQHHQRMLDTVCHHLQDVHLTSDVYTLSPPSMSLPNASCQHQQRIKDVRLPVKSLRARMTTTTTCTSLVNPNQSEKMLHFKNKEQIVEIKDRPRKDTIRFNKRQKESLCRRHKYSSTESMTTSSSGGSMESLRSSTSEGNRSTTSSESRHSTSLSSHSSDSGGVGYLSHFTQTSSFLVHTNKLHILSPISDKSSQEPASETSDNNKNNNSQKCSPEELSPPEMTTGINIKTKRRVPQNKNLLNLTEIQGSDSGISIQSRDGVKSRFGFGSELTTVQQDLADLPFDMPKLRRRRLGLGLMEQQDACTSGSTTSVDLRDLPFDMPKLRRRLRVPQSSTESSVSQASSSQSVLEADKQIALFRPKLTLNLGDSARPALNLNIGNNTSVLGPTDMIDTSLPLERQGWYHGAITRVEAECVLRLLREGSFLVRNSESTRQDYSLSLKSAKGFMHMRIQRSGTDGPFILGQFSKPFHSIPEMIRHFSLNRLPVRGAEHMCLLQPVIAQLL